MHELRRHRRMKIPLQVELQHPAVGCQQVEALDMSENGLYLRTENPWQLKLDDVLQVRVAGLGSEGKEYGPELAMYIVRCDGSGIGLKLVEPLNSEFLEAEISPPLNSAPSPSVLQSLLLVNQQQQILLCMQGDHWRLPSRKLSCGESWQDGLKQLVDELKANSVIAATVLLSPSPHCFPESSKSSACIDLIVPCLLEQSETSSIPASYQWLASAELASINCSLKAQTVDKILAQV